MQKDFITATPDSGGSGSTTVTAAASANQTESARSVCEPVSGWRRNDTYCCSESGCGSRDLELLLFCHSDFAEFRCGW